MLETLSVRTNTRTELLDLTSQVQEVVNKSGVSEGLCHVFVPHTTAAVTINENADPSVK
ncbi:MAG: YjbQ family protein, partial [Deltaproteobacteria bacterium]|nr:YjbQ family protein [Deltaproteobacteria bacterium]